MLVLLPKLVLPLVLLRLALAQGHIALPLLLFGRRRLANPLSACLLSLVYLPVEKGG